MKLPEKIRLHKYAELMSEMHKQCYNDIKTQENIDRFINLFDVEYEDPVEYVVLSLVYDPKSNVYNKKDYKTYILGASAVIQLSSPHEGCRKKNTIPIYDRQPFINEVCKHSKIDDKDKMKQYNNSYKPVDNVFEISKEYIRRRLMREKRNINGLYLYIEKVSESNSAAHNPQTLINIYERKGFDSCGEDDEFFHMKHTLISTSTSVSTAEPTIKNDTKNNPASNSKKIITKCPRTPSTNTTKKRNRTPSKSPSSNIIGTRRSKIRKTQNEKK